MFSRLERFVSALFLCAFAAIGGGGALAARTADELTVTERLVSHTHDVMDALDGLLSILEEAESGERGFVLTGDESFLPAYERADVLANERLAAVRALVTDSRRQVPRVDTLATHVDHKLTAMRSIIAARRAGGRDSAVVALAASAGPVHMAAVRQVVRAMDAEERRLLVLRRAAFDASTRRTSRAALALGASSLTMLTLAFATVRGARRRQRRAEARTAEANAELRARVDDLVRHGRESAILAQLAESLQLCLTPAEAHAALGQILPVLVGVPGSAGMLAMMRASHNRVEQVAGWGAAGHDALAFAPEDCCALRSGRPYAVRDGDARPRCAHAALDRAAHEAYVCLPLSAHGETLGVLHVLWPRAAHGAADPLALLKTACETIAVALANLALRDRLKQQSIRDALTGTFNRRYLEESLDREVARARRHREPLAVLMLDVDHFKRVNDDHGHEAGDDVLRAVAEALTRGVRDEDVVCRYGGEEFAVLLPGIPPDAARMRAEALLEAVRALRVSHRGQRLAPVTASIGVALYSPARGEDGPELVRRADAALYAAKRAGRDRVLEADVGDAAPAAGAAAPR
jgi:diguanylate cyclase (GGDEF)-like protein